MRCGRGGWSCTADRPDHVPAARCIAIPCRSAWPCLCPTSCVIPPPAQVLIDQVTYGPLCNIMFLGFTGLALEVRGERRGAI